MFRLTHIERLADGSTHWSTRTLAARVGIGKDAVAKIWVDQNLTPWRVSGLTDGSVADATFSTPGATCALTRPGTTWQVNAQTPTDWEGGTQVFRVVLTTGRFMRSGSSSTRRRVATGRLPRWLAAFAAFLSVALCAAGCASEPAPDPAPVGADGVTGVVVLADDTSDAVAADGGGAIVSIPSAGTGALLDHVGSVLPGRTPPLSELPYVQFALDADLARSWGAEVAEVDDDGRFALTASGPVVMCRLVDDAAGSYARGCDETTLPTRGQVRVSFGEGGLQVRELDGDAAARGGLQGGATQEATAP